MRIYGGMPTGLGNEAGLVAGSPSFQIGPRSPFKGMPQEQLNELKNWDQDPNGLQQYYDRMNRQGPSLPNIRMPLAYNPLQGGVPMGNAGFFAGPQLGQVPAGFQNKIVS